MTHPLRLLPPSILVAALGIAGCTMGPDFDPPAVAAPDSWSSARGGGPELADPQVRSGVGGATVAQWRQRLGDPALDDLQARALAANQDLRGAALRLAETRVQRVLAGAGGAPQVAATADAIRRRQSERGGQTRLIDVVGGRDAEALKKLLSEPYSLYETGFDAAWELDLWGRVRRFTEAAEADLAASRADLEYLRTTIQAEVARAYFELRGTQQEIALAQADIAASAELLELLRARADGGLIDDAPVRRQSTQLAGLRAGLPQLLEGEAALLNQLTLLVGAQPGALNARLARPAAEARRDLPDLALGLPSELVRNRADVRAAEARLHAATARIGVAVADLYPRFTIGGSFGLEAIGIGDLADWGSRTWSIGPSLTVPLFDGGRRRATVTLRTLQQQEAAVAYQKIVLRAWHEVDGALSAYTAERQRNAALAEKERDSNDAYGLAEARYRNGLVTWLDVLDAERGLIQARRERARSASNLAIALVAIEKALGGAGPGAAAAVAAPPGPR